MKKKIFLSGINAKTALAIVALSGALLTGCYKDDGLDVNDPAGSVTLPAATYTIAGTVIDAETGQPIDGATVKGAGSDIPTVNGNFTIAAEAKVYTLEVIKDGYDKGTATVDVKPLQAGQAAVYSPVIRLAPKKNGTYTLNFKVLEETTPITDAKISLYNTAGELIKEVENNTIAGLENNKTYIAKIEKAGYVTMYVSIELPAVVPNTVKDITVFLTKAATKMVRISGYLRINGAPWANTVIEISHNGTKLDTQNGPAYTFQVPEDLFAPKTRAAGSEKEATFQFKVIDISGQVFEFDKTVSVQEGGEGSESSADFDMLFNATFEAIETATGVDEPWQKEINHKNDSEWACTLDFTWNYYTGSEITEPKFDASKLSTLGINMGTGLYNAIVSAYDKIAAGYEDFKTEKKKEVLTVLPLTILESITVHHYFTVGKLQLTQLSIQTTGDSSDASVGEDIVKAMEDNYSAYKTAESNSYYPKTSPIGHGHSHGHGHGHGDDPNAGGGIVEAE